MIILKPSPNSQLLTRPEPNSDMSPGTPMHEGTPEGGEDAPMTPYSPVSMLSPSNSVLSPSTSIKEESRLEEILRQSFNKSLINESLLPFQFFFFGGGSTKVQSNPKIWFHNLFMLLGGGQYMSIKKSLIFYCFCLLGSLARSYRPIWNWSSTSTSWRRRSPLGPRRLHPCHRRRTND